MKHAVKSTANGGCPKRIFGVDFSGAAHAGKSIWITEATLEERRLRILDCQSAQTFLDVSAKREDVLPALREFIAAQSNAFFGMDYAFGIPQGSTPESEWREFVIQFPDHFPTAESFRSHCRRVFNVSEAKRKTDKETRTPFSPYNLRMYRQTYYGIAAVLAPLVREDLARVVPMQSPNGSLPLLLEVCPASLLKRLQLYQPYKGKGERLAEERERIFRLVFQQKTIEPVSDEIVSRVISDEKGDALDSLLCAYIVYQRLASRKKIYPQDVEKYKLEGMVYC